MKENIELCDNGKAYMQIIYTVIITLMNNEKQYREKYFNLVFW